MDGFTGTTTWLGRLKLGESAAAQKIWEAYFSQLVRLARSKLTGNPRRAADEEDVAAAAFFSFCRGVEQGRFPQLDDSHDLWQVLVMLTVRKAIDQQEHDGRQKRGAAHVRGESIFGNDEIHGRGIEQIVGVEPTPEFAAQIAEEFQRLLNLLGNSELRQIAVLKFEGSSNQEIAAQLDCSLRSVERKLSLIRRMWEDEVE